MQVDDLLAELSRQARLGWSKRPRRHCPRSNPRIKAPIGKPRLGGESGRKGREQDLAALVAAVWPPQDDLGRCLKRWRHKKVGEETTADRRHLAEFMIHELDTLGLAIRHPVVDRIVQPSGRAWWRGTSRALRFGAIRSGGGRHYSGLAGHRVRPQRELAEQAQHRCPKPRTSC